MRNQIGNLNNFVSSPVAATRDALTKILAECTWKYLFIIQQNDGCEWDRLKEIAGKEAREEDKEGQAKEETDLITQEHERALKGAYKIFVIPGLPIADIDGYFKQDRISRC